MSDCEELTGGYSQGRIVVWRRESRPLMLILLKKLIIQLFLPPNLPPNVRLRQLNLYKGLYRISMNISEFD